jgi:hypothetical protein
MVALGIESRRERQDMSGTKLHAKATGLAALHDNRNTSFCHEIPQRQSDDSLREFNNAGFDYAVRPVAGGVTSITERREVRHDRVLE